MSGEQPGNRVARGIAWAMASQVGRQVLTFVTTIVLARHLRPDDFGLIGMATVFTGLVTIINDVGVSGALVQRRTVTQSHLSSMFWLNLIVGATLCALTIAVAPVVAGFFGSPELADVLRVLSLIFVTGALGIVQQAVLVRAMDFRRLGIIETLAVLLSGIVAIACVVAGLGVWSLVVQLLLVPTLTSLGLWIRSDWRPARIFDRKALAELLPFGVSMAGFNVVNYLSRNADYLIVGRFLGAAALGYYTLAYRLMIYPLQAVSTAVGRVSFPAFSRAEGDPVLLAEGFMRMTKGVSLVTFPMVLGIFAIAPEFVVVVYGEQWAPTIELLRILCFAGLVQSVGTTVGSVYQALGKPALQLRMALLNAALTVLALGIGLQWGLTGVAVAYSMFAVAWVHFSLFVVTRLISLPYGRMYRRFMPAMASSGLMLAGVLALKPLLGPPSLAGLAVMVLAGALLHGTTLTLLGELRWHRCRPVMRLETG